MNKPVILVTGATDGIGRQTALELARRGATVLVHGRSEEKATRAAHELGGEASATLVPFAADLASLADVRRLAVDLRARAPRLTVLVHNAGVFDATRHLTVDGYERTLQVNHLAPFLLTHLLLDVLKGNAPARVVSVSSGVHERARLDLEDLQAERRYDGYGAYSASKLANVLFVNELARRLGTTEIGAFALHPGVIGTKLLREGFGMGGASLAEGARTSVFVALDPSLAGQTARYYADVREKQSAVTARDPALMRALYDESCRLVGIEGLPG